MTPWLRCLLLPICLAAAVGMCAGAYEETQEPASLRVEVEPDASGTFALRLSDRVRVTLTVDGAVPRLPVKLIDSPDWDVRPEKPITETVGGKSRWRQTFLAAPRKPGTLMLEPRPVTVGGDTVEWRPVPVKVATDVGRADVKELRDVLPPEPAPPEPPLLRWLAWGGGTVGGAVLVLLAWRLLQRTLVRPPKPLTPAEEALRELDRIESLGLPAAGKSERYHTLIADTVRVYLERRYLLRAPRQTTAEFLRSVQESPELNESQRERLREFLGRCDVVKFAGERATEEACAAVGAMAREFVAETLTLAVANQARR
jgi:hypothetical protein